MLNEIGFEAYSAVGLEPNKTRLKYSKQKGFKIFERIDQIKDNSLDVITLFHVLEHLLDPVKTLKLLKKN